MHTLGPWREDEDHRIGARAIIGDGQQLVALVYGRTPEEQVANVAVICAMPVWQDIDTAPRDGTTVDCWVAGHRLENCFFGRPHHECLSEYCDSCPDDLEVECWRWSFGNEPINPTHWMPLPAAPQ